MDDSVIVGNPKRFGFEIAPINEEAIELREVEIFVAGTRITKFDKTAYVPAFIGRLEESSLWLKSKIDYGQFVEEFSGKNVPQIHEFLCDENGRIADAHRFLDRGELTDCIRSFLIPYFGNLHLTFESVAQHKNEDERSTDIKGIVVTPYELIVAIDQAAAHLRSCF